VFKNIDKLKNTAKNMDKQENHVKNPDKGILIKTIAT